MQCRQYWANRWTCPPPHLSPSELYFFLFQCLRRRLFDKQKKEPTPTWLKCESLLPIFSPAQTNPASPDLTPPPEWGQMSVPKSPWYLCSNCVDCICQIYVPSSQASHGARSCLIASPLLEVISASAVKGCSDLHRLRYTKVHCECTPQVHGSRVWG